MVAAAAATTQPCFAAQSTATQESQSTRRRWTPDGDAHLIFQWVKMEGKTQGWVAMQLGLVRRPCPALCSATSAGRRMPRLVKMAGSIQPNGCGLSGG